jgi:hypothetical protein
MYSAPEMMFAPWQKGPESVYGAGVDTWSLGAIAYELFSGNFLAFAASKADIVSHWVALLGQPPKGLSLGPRQGSLMCAAAGFHVEAPPMPESDDFTIIRALLAWNPMERMSAEVARRSLSSKCHPASALCPLDEPGARSTEDVHRDDVETVAETAFQTPPPRRFGKALEEVVFSTAKKGCQCKGHCWTSGHRYHGCSAKTVVAGTGLCQQCLCVVPGCGRPRHHGPDCYKHERAFKDWPAPVQATRLLGLQAGLAEDMLPIDIVDFMSVVSTLGGDLVLVFPKSYKRRSRVDTTHLAPCVVGGIQTRTLHDKTPSLNTNMTYDTTCTCVYSEAAKRSTSPLGGAFLKIGNRSETGSI